MTGRDAELDELERRIRLLEEENAGLAESHEDALLLGLVAEQVQKHDDRPGILRAGLERISMVKDLPLCLCLSLGGSEATILEHYASFTDAPPRRPALSLSGRLPDRLRHGSQLLEGTACSDAGVRSAFAFDPVAVLVLPFRSRAVPEGAFLFADDRSPGRLRRAEIFLNRLVELVIARLDNVTLLEELALRGIELERKVRERTRELADRNLALEREIEEHRSTVDALRQSEERFRAAFTTIPDAISISRLTDGVFIAVNEGFTRLTGWSEQEAIGRSSLELGMWEDPADRQRLAEGLKHHRRVENVEARLRLKDGQSTSGLVSVTHLQLGNEQCVLTVARDVAELKRAQAERDRLSEQLRQAQKMEAMGRLAGGVAHDFNNLLTVILSCAGALREEVTAGRPVDAEDVEAIQAAGQRARELTRQLLAFARKQVVQPEIFDLGDALLRAEKLLHRVLGEDIELAVVTEPALWPVHCDPGQLEQVLMNLAVNARDAMPAGGRLTLALRNVSAPGNGAAARGRPGDWVLLAVRDTGMGMDSSIKAHLFEPFFTTKPLGAGTGLGLATVYGIVDQAGGFLHVDSAPGKGTIVEVWLPRSEHPAVARAEPTQATAQRGTETVLAVEDDPLVRALTVRVLRAAGYRVLVASRATEALELASGGEPIDLVVTDVVMPGLDGRALAAELHRTRPGMPVLYVSGYSGDAIAQRGVLDPGIELLPKPFTATDLLGRVRTLLDGLTTSG